MRPCTTMATEKLDPTLTRRSWLTSSALMALYVWTSTGARGLAPKTLSALRVDAIIIDAGLPESATLARGARSQVRVEMLDDDVAELFYGRLGSTWRERGVRGLAGLTRAPALFLMEPLAHEYGLRTVGLQRAPLTGGEVLTNLGHQRTRRTVIAEQIRRALLEHDDAVFAWFMAPLRLPVRPGITVIPT